METNKNGITGFHKGWLGLDQPFSNVSQLEAGLGKKYVQEILDICKQLDIKNRISSCFLLMGDKNE